MLGRKEPKSETAGKGNRDDRRSSPRYNVVEDAAWLGWRDETEFQTRHALILDVSLRGASITADEVPETERVWICLDGPTPTDWIEARVVGVVRTRMGPHKLRLAFENQCPYAFFKAAVYGFEALNLRALPETEKHRYGTEWW